jgi:hypothetical protein
MSISEPFRYRNDSFQSDIFSSDIGITDVDVGCRISPILRSMSMPTYGFPRCRWPATYGGKFYDLETGHNMFVQLNL